MAIDEKKKQEVVLQIAKKLRQLDHMRWSLMFYEDDATQIFDMVMKGVR